MAKHSRIYIEGEVTGGESVVVEIDAKRYDYTARKQDTAGAIGAALAEKINASVGHANQVQAGPVENGLAVWSRQGWTNEVSAYSDDPALTVNVIGEHAA